MRWKTWFTNTSLAIPKLQTWESLLFESESNNDTHTTSFPSITMIQDATFDKWRAEQPEVPPVFSSVQGYRVQRRDGSTVILSRKNGRNVYHDRKMQCSTYRYRTVMKGTHVYHVQVACLLKISRVIKQNVVPQRMMRLPRRDRLDKLFCLRTNPPWIDGGSGAGAVFFPHTSQTCSWLVTAPPSTPPTATTILVPVLSRTLPRFLEPGSAYFTCFACLKYGNAYATTEFSMTLGTGAARLLG